MAAAGHRHVFTDGHGLASFTAWFDDLTRLDAVDWQLLGEKFWHDTPEDNDRQRRKQAEFLVWKFLSWDLIRAIAVLNPAMKQRVEGIIGGFPARKQVDVYVIPSLYY